MAITGELSGNNTGIIDFSAFSGNRGILPPVFDDNELLQSLLVKLTPAIDGTIRDERAGLGDARDIQAGRAYRSDGSDDYVFFDYVKSGHTKVSIGAFAKDDGSSNSARICSIGGGAERGVDIRFDTTNNKYSIVVGSSASTWTIYLCNDVFDIDEWHHVFAVIDGTSFKFYVDGVETPVTQTASSGGGFDGTFSDTTRINMFAASDNGFRSAAFIHDFKVYVDAAKTASQVLDIYNHKIDLDGIVLHWKCEDTHATAAYDSSGNGNDGTKTGITLATFHYEGDDVPYSYANEVGYSDTNIPRDESDITLDVLGNALDYSGKVPMNAQAINSPCGTFDGGNGYIDLGVTDITGWQSFYFECWFNSDAVSAIDFFFSILHSNNDDIRIIFNGSDKIEFAMDDGGTVLCATANTYRDENTYKLTAEFSGTSLVLKVYDEGGDLLETATSTDSFDFSTSANGATGIGDRVGGSLVMDGKLWGVKFGETKDNLSGYYPLSERSGSVAHDVSGNENHGTIMNATTTPDAGFWANTQDTFHYALANGFTDGKNLIPFSNELTETWAVSRAGAGLSPVINIIDSDSLQNLPDASQGSDAGKGFTITGLAYDNISNTIWAGNFGQATPSSPSETPQLVELSLDGSTILQEHDVSNRMQGVAYDSADDVLYYAAPIPNEVRRMNKDGTGEATVISGTTALNGLTYDSIRDELWLSDGQDLKRYSKAGVLQETKALGFTIDHMWHDASKDWLWVTFGSSGTQGFIAALTVSDLTEIKRYTLADAYAVEGVFIKDGQFFIANDGHYHGGDIPDTDDDLNQLQTYPMDYGLNETTLPDYLKLDLGGGATGSDNAFLTLTLASDAERTFGAYMRAAHEADGVLDVSLRMDDTTNTEYKDISVSRAWARYTQTKTTGTTSQTSKIILRGDRPASDVVRVFVDSMDLQNGIELSAHQPTFGAPNVDVAVPALLDGSTDATGAPISNPAGAWHNGCTTKIDFTYGIASAETADWETDYEFNDTRTNPLFVRLRNKLSYNDRMLAYRAALSGDDLTKVEDYTASLTSEFLTSDGQQFLTSNGIEFYQGG